MLQSVEATKKVLQSWSQEVDVKDVDVLSSTSDDVDKLLDKYVATRVSTEIVYKFCDLVDADGDDNGEAAVLGDNGFLPEPALYRVEASNFGPKLTARLTASSAAASLEYSDNNSDSEKNSEIFI